MINIIKKYKVYFIIVILVVANLFLFSGISPLQSIYNMQYDEWLFYLIGKGMVNGKVPYRDLMDHKGPYLFYFFALMNMLPTNHLGLFIFSSIIYVFIAIFSYKISYLILSHYLLESYDTNDLSVDKIKTYVSVFVAFVTFFMASSYYLSFGTITSEIITLPFIFSTYYLFLKYLLSDDHKHKISDMIIYGISAGIVFFIKANAILAYLPIAIYILFYLIYKKEYINLVKNIFVGFISFVVALLPAIIYCIVTNSLNDMIEGSFIINFLYTGQGMPGASSIYESLFDTIDKFKEYTILCIMSSFAIGTFLKKHIRAKVIIFYVLSLIINIYSVYMACRPYTNYLASLLFYFIPLFVFFAFNMVRALKPKKPVFILLVVIILINVLSYSLTYELSNLSGIAKKNMASRVLKIYNQSNYRIKNPKLLVVGYEPYLYEAFDTIPDEKYFATPVVDRKVYSEPYDALVKRVDSHIDDMVIVSLSRRMATDTEFKDNIYRALDENYESIGSTKYLGVTCELFIKRSNYY